MTNSAITCVASSYASEFSLLRQRSNFTLYICQLSLSSTYSIYRACETHCEGTVMTCPLATCNNTTSNYGSKTTRTRAPSPNFMQFTDVVNGRSLEMTNPLNARLSHKVRHHFGWTNYLQKVDFMEYYDDPTSSFTAGRRMCNIQIIFRGKNVWKPHVGRISFREAQCTRDTSSHHIPLVVQTYTALQDQAYNLHNQFVTFWALYRVTWGSDLGLCPHDLKGIFKASSSPNILADGTTNRKKKTFFTFIYSSIRIHAVVKNVMLSTFWHHSIVCAYTSICINKTISWQRLWQL